MDKLKALIEKDSWLEHVPLPRVMEIMMNHIASSHLLDEQLIKVIPHLCISSGKHSKECLKLVQQVPSESSVWDRLVETLEEGKPISDHIITAIYKQRPPALDKHILESFDILSDIAILQVNQLLENNTIPSGITSIYVNFLSHKCLATGVTLEIKYNYLPGVIASCKDFINRFLRISNIFLDNCYYSVTSIKVVNLFYYLFKDKICLPNDLLFGSIDYDLVNMLFDPPCLTCNKLVSHENDLGFISKNVRTLLICCSKNNLGLIRTILSIHCEWLIYMKDFPEVRSLFMQLIDFS